MEFEEFTDVNLDNSDNSRFLSCEDLSVVVSDSDCRSQSSTYSSLAISQNFEDKFWNDSNYENPGAVRIKECQGIEKGETDTPTIPEYHQHHNAQLPLSGDNFSALTVFPNGRPSSTVQHVSTNHSKSTPFGTSGARSAASEMLNRRPTVCSFTSTPDAVLNRAVSQDLCSDLNEANQSANQVNVMDMIWDSAQTLTDKNVSSAGEAQSLHSPSHSDSSYSDAASELSAGCVVSHSQPFPGDDFDEQDLIRHKRFGSDASNISLASSKTQDNLVTNSLDISEHQQPPQFSKQISRSSLDELLFELYDSHGHSGRCSEFSMDGSSTDYSSITIRSGSETSQGAVYSSSTLQDLDVVELKQILSDLTMKVTQKNTQLVKCLRNRERHKIKEAKHCDMITAILHAWSSKTSSDAKMKFSLEPVSGEEQSFEQWRGAVAALARRPIGIPNSFRYKIWLALASDYINSLQLNWNKVIQFAFNDKCNPDDDALGLQIVKDLHRTGCSSFSGIENEEDRVTLQRVLLGYARWNKVTGYCQGFNILAALILDVTDKNEADALKIMVYMVDKVLPKEYFSHNLRALTVDMAVFRSYLSMKLPKLSAHLIRLQEDSQDSTTGANVEPPLTNVFTMQWFLTIFATCLPIETVHKVWDCVLLDGCEILIRTALAIWTKLAKKLIKVQSADEFYMKMGSLSQDLHAGSVMTSDELIHNIYKMAPLPLPKLTQLREKFMYDITPFSAVMNSASRSAAYSEEEGGDDIQELAKRSGTATDLATSKTMDVSLLKKQYSQLIYRQKQARVLMKAVPTNDAETPMAPKSTTPIAMNHLFIGKELSETKRLEALTRASAKMRAKLHQEDCDAVRATTPRITDELATSCRITNRTANKTMANSSLDEENSRLEEAIQQGIARGVYRPTVSPDASSSVCSAASIDDDVFYSQPLAQSRKSASHTTASSHSPAVSPSTTTGKLYSPFPKPVTGLLSADKAKIGVRLGLYTTRDALSYMNPSQRSQFIAGERKGYLHSSKSQIVSASKSTFW